MYKATSKNRALLPMASSHAGSRRAEKIPCFLAGLLLSLCIVLPTAFRPVKLVLFVALLLFIGKIALTRSLRMNTDLYLLSGFYALIGLMWSFYGYIAGNPGALAVLSVMVIYPLTLPLISSLYRREHESSLYTVLLVCAWIIAILDLLFIVGALVFPGNALQTFFEWLYPDWAVVDFSDSYIRWTLPNISSLIFLLPFFIAVLLFPRKRTGRVSTFLLVCLLLAIGLLSGRRGLIVSMILGPAIAFVITLGARKNRRNKSWNRSLSAALIISSVALFIYTFILKIGVNNFLELAMSVFDFENDDGNQDRARQFRALMRGVFDSPYFGKGAGAVAEVIRSVEMPWSYELFYVSLIFQYGILGFLLYSLGGLFICLHLNSSIKKKGRSSFEFYFLSGFLAFMLATATNPYIGKFDYMWVIFIPYAMINLKKLSRKRTVMERDDVHAR